MPMNVMPDDTANAIHDPRPQPPEKPLPQECCESGCPICVYDLYADELESYRLALAAWTLRHPGNSDTAP